MRRVVPLAVVLLCGLAPWTRADGGAPAGRHLAEAAVDLAEGLAAFEAGRNEEALSWLAESARLNPEEGEPHYWRGLTLLRLGRSREAAGELEASLEAHHPPEVDRARVLSDLEAARRASEGETIRVETPAPSPAGRPIDDRGLWEGMAGLSLAADSNPNLFSQELILPPPSGNKGGLIRGEEKDTKVRPAVSLGIYPFHDRPGPNLGVSLEVRRSFHQDFGFLDLGEAHGVAHLAYGSDPLGYLEGALGSARVPFGASRLTALIQAGGAAYQVDSASYLQTWGGAASITFHELAATATRLDLGYEDCSFSHSGLADARRSGKDLSIQPSQLFYFGRRDRYARIGALMVGRQAGRVFSESIREGNAELAWPFALRWTVHLEGGVREDDFDHPESNLFRLVGGPVRNDRTRRGALTLIWAATDRLRLIARGTYVKRSSNVDLGDGLPDLDYQRKIASVGVSWVF
jgi:tetratricopeptide (TPR) repeat protein